MGRLNLTLDSDTEGRLSRHAKKAGAQKASFARALLREALERRERMQRRRKIAEDYSAGRADAKALLGEMEAAQLELLDEEES